MGYSPCGRKELETTERLHFHFPVDFGKFSPLCWLLSFSQILTVYTVTGLCLRCCKNESDTDTALSLKARR